MAKKKPGKIVAKISGKQLTTTKIPATKIPVKITFHALLESDEGGGGPGGGH